MAETKRALITGITGQDGSYLTELLLEKGYEVYGLVRHVRGRQYIYIHSLLASIQVIEGDLMDRQSVQNAIQEAQPNEIYNLAAVSFVGDSWKKPNLYMSVNGLGALNVFEVARAVVPNARIYQASSSEQFGNAPAPQSEQTCFVPRSPYGASKVFAHNMARIYRDSYKLHISCGICFNHESPRRGPEFVTKKIAINAAKASKDKKHRFRLGDLKPKRDWGWAPDYVKAMWLMLQAEKADDYVVATGEMHSVLEFLEAVFGHVGLDWKDHVDLDPGLVRPTEVFELRGSRTKILERLEWAPTVSFEMLVKKMVDAELEVQNDKPKR